MQPRIRDKNVARVVRSRLFRASNCPHSVCLSTCLHWSAWRPQSLLRMEYHHAQLDCLSRSASLPTIDQNSDQTSYTTAFSRIVASFRKVFVRVYAVAVVIKQKSYSLPSVFPALVVDLLMVPTFMPSESLCRIVGNQFPFASMVSVSAALLILPLLATSGPQ